MLRQPVLEHVNKVVLQGVVVRHQLDLPGRNSSYRPEVPRHDFGIVGGKFDDRHLGIAEGTDPDRDSDRVPPLVPTDPLRNLIDVDAARLRGFRLGGTRGGAPPSPRPRLQPRYERLPLTLLRLRGLQDLDRGAQVLVEPLR